MVSAVMVVSICYKAISQLQLSLYFSNCILRTFRVFYLWVTPSFWFLPHTVSELTRFDWTSISHSCYGYCDCCSWKRRIFFLFVFEVRPRSREDQSNHPMALDLPEIPLGGSLHGRRSEFYFILVEQEFSKKWQPRSLKVWEILNRKTQTQLEVMLVIFRKWDAHKILVLDLKITYGIIDTFYEHPNIPFFFFWRQIAASSDTDRKILIYRSKSILDFKISKFMVRTSINEMEESGLIHKSYVAKTHWVDGSIFGTFVGALIFLNAIFMGFSVESLSLRDTDSLLSSRDNHNCLWM